MGLSCWFADIRGPVRRGVSRVAAHVHGSRFMERDDHVCARTGARSFSRLLDVYHAVSGVLPSYPPLLVAGLLKLGRPPVSTVHASPPKDVLALQHGDDPALAARPDHAAAPLQRMRTVSTRTLPELYNCLLVTWTDLDPVERTPR